MYRLIVTDLDGTLLNDEKKIGELTKKVLQESGIPVVFSSARGFYRIKEYAKDLGTDNSENYSIAFNGSVITDNTGKAIVDNSIDMESLKMLVEYGENHPEFNWSYYIFDKTVNRKAIPDIQEFIQKNPVYKVVCQTAGEDISPFRKQLDSNLIDHLEVTSSTIERIEFVKKGCTKVKALANLLEKLGITKEEIICFGDGENDIQMLEYGGLAVAVNNATDAVKACVDMITDDNNHDGVGKALLQILKK